MASEQRPLREMALFAGAGGGILGGILLGWETVCAVEINAFCARRLMQRQNEGHLPPFPIWDDVSTFDGRPWRGLVDVVSGGFPCQGISIAGDGLGLDDPRSGLWKEYARLVCEIRPLNVLVENSPALTFRGLGTVLGDLASMGYNVQWGVFAASDAIWIGGAPAFDHQRDRLFIKASDSNRIGKSQPKRCESNEWRWIRDSAKKTLNAYYKTKTGTIASEAEYSRIRNGTWWASEPNVDRMANGVAFKLDRDRSIGNGQVPDVVKLAWDCL